MSTNTLFLIMLFSIALSACNETKKNCLVDVEIEYSEDYNSIFDQFDDMFEDKKEENSPSLNHHEDEYSEDEEDDDEYTKVEQFIPANIKKNCNIEIDSVVPSKHFQFNMKQICKN